MAPFFDREDRCMMPPCSAPGKYHALLVSLIGSHARQANMALRDPCTTGQPPTVCATKVGYRGKCRRVLLKVSSSRFDPTQTLRVIQIGGSGVRFVQTLAVYSKPFAFRTA